MKSILIFAILIALCALAGCGIDPSPARGDQAKAAFSDVLDLYNERLELVDEATALARPYLPADSSALTDMANARSTVTALHATPDFIDTPASFERFDIAQRQLTEAISQLMIVCESVHRLNAVPRFRTLQAQLASSAGRIAVARDRYDSAARRYNSSLHRFPSNLAEAIHAGQDKPTFSVRDGSPVHRRPRTDFGALRGSPRV
jgi:LemA protein